MDDPHYFLERGAKWRRCPMGMGQKIDLEHSFCLGSECMAWRWAKLSDMSDDGKIRLDPVYSTTHGYCGMVRQQ